MTEGRAVARAEPPAKIYDGTFETDADFARYVVSERFDMVVDAAHPFEARLGTIARALGLPYLRVTRQNGHPSIMKTGSTLTLWKMLWLLSGMARGCSSPLGGAAFMHFRIAPMSTLCVVS